MVKKYPKTLKMRAVYTGQGLGLSHINAPFRGTPCGTLPWDTHPFIKSVLLLWWLDKVLLFFFPLANTIFL